MAAATPPFSNEISFVFSVGAHDDLLRVATFYATEADPLPNGDVGALSPTTTAHGCWSMSTLKILCRMRMLPQFVLCCALDSTKIGHLKNNCSPT